MPQSLTQVYLHIIFSTKNRIPVILPHMENDLYYCIEHQCHRMGCPVIQVGGYLDHVHILCRLSKHTTVPKLLEVIKGTSSKWIKTKHTDQDQFYWQDGYAAFSVSPRNVDAVAAYIRQQPIHHASISFKEEYLDLLKKSKIQFDPRYIWD